MGPDYFLKGSEVFPAGGESPAEVGEKGDLALRPSSCQDRGVELLSRRK